MVRPRVRRAMMQVRKVGGVIVVGALSDAARSGVDSVVQVIVHRLGR